MNKNAPNANSRTEWMQVFACCAERFKDILIDDGMQCSIIAPMIEAAYRYWAELGACLNYPSLPNDEPDLSDADRATLELYAWTLPEAVLNYALSRHDATDLDALPSELVEIWDAERAMLRMYI